MRWVLVQEYRKEAPVVSKDDRIQDIVKQWGGSMGNGKVLLTVKGVRESQGLTQQQFAERYGFTLDFVQNMEQGRRTRTQGTKWFQLLLRLIRDNPDFMMEVAMDLSQSPIIIPDTPASPKKATALLEVYVGGSRSKDEIQRISESLARVNGITRVQYYSDMMEARWCILLWFVPDSDEQVKQRFHLHLTEHALPNIIGYHDFGYEFFNEVAVVK